MTLRTFLVVHRPRPRLSDESLTRCHMICELLENERASPWLYIEGMLRKVSLLPAIYMETVDAPLTLGEHSAWYYLRFLQHPYIS